MEKILFTKEQTDALRPFEKYFDTAVNHEYARCPKREELRLIFDIFVEATGDTRRLNGSCQKCILNLMRDCGNIYFDTINVKAAVKKTRKRNTTKSQ